MTAGAFHGDPAVKRSLLDAIDRHAAAGTLVFDGPVWDGIRGSPMGIAIEGEDPTVFATRYGFPVPLATLFDAIMRAVPGDAEAVRAARDWIDAVPVGADLSRIATLVVLEMLDVAEARGIDDMLSMRLVALHLGDLDGRPAPRAEWAAVRRDVLAVDVPIGEGLRRDVFMLWEACCSSATRGRSTAAYAFNRWCHVRARGAAGDWTAQDEARAQATLTAISNEHRGAIEADEKVDFATLFMSADPVLATRYVEHLDRSNARFLESGIVMARWSGALLAKARPAVVSAGGA